MPGVNNVLAVHQRQLLRDMPRSDTGLEVEGQGRDLSGAPGSQNLPWFAHDFTMGRVLLTGDRFRIASEGQAEEITAQRDEHRRRHRRRLFILPRRDVVRPHRSVGVAEERDRSHVAPAAGDRNLDLRRGDNPTGLGMDRAFRGGNLGGHRNGQEEQAQPSQGFAFHGSAHESGVSANFQAANTGPKVLKP